MTMVRVSAAAGAALVSVILTLPVIALGITPAPPPASQRFPDVELTTHVGKRVRFYDLIKGRTVAIELIYTTCQFACPLETARLAQVQALLGDRMGRDVFFYSISIDPAHDTPAALKAFAEKYHAGPGWTFLTGSAGDIERLSKSLGLYAAPDPDNKDGHMPALLIGNEATGQWIRGSALDNPRMTATMIGSWVDGYRAAPAVKSYAEATPLPRFSRGQYVFSTRCSACHSVGGGTRVGPDLAGVTHARDPRWLARYIAAPDEMIDAGDAAATALAAQYKDVRMPNLGLSDHDVHEVIAYLDSIH